MLRPRRRGRGRGRAGRARRVGGRARARRRLRRLVPRGRRDQRDARRVPAARGRTRDLRGRGERRGRRVRADGPRRAEDGGYTVSGRWRFGSGVQHCDWLMGGSLVEEGEGLREAPSGAPDIRFMLFPASEVEVHDTWNVSGLRGTGSHDFSLDSLRVPEEHSASLITDSPRSDGPLYAFPVFGLLALSISAVGLGIARAAIEDLAELATAKKPAGSTRTLAERGDTQAAVAGAEAKVRSARALIDEAVGEAWESATASGEVPPEQKAAPSPRREPRDPLGSRGRRRDVRARRRHRHLRDEPAPAPLPRHPRRHGPHAGRPRDLGARRPRPARARTRTPASSSRRCRPRLARPSRRASPRPRPCRPRRSGRIRWTVRVTPAAS